MKRHLLALGLFALLSVVMTWPLVQDMGGSLLGPPQDNYYYLSWLSWLREGLLRGQPSTLNPNVFYPYGHDFNTSETTWANVLLALPVLLAFGEVAAYNVAVLISFFLSGLGMYLLVIYLTGNGWAAVISGAIYAFSPYRMAHLGGGQLPLLGTQWLPLCLYGIERALREDRAAWGLAAGLFFALAALSSWYYAFMFGLLLPIYLLVRAWPWKHSLRQRSVWGALAGFLAVTAVMVVPAAIPTLGQSQGAAMSYSLQWVDRWSASIADYVLPNAMHPLWGEITTRFYAGQGYFYERILYLGLLPLALAAVGWWAGRGSQGDKRRFGLALLWMGGVALVLSLGTSLHWRGVEPVHIPVPGNLDQLFTRGLFNLVTRFSLNPSAYHWGYERPGHIILPLPALLLYLYVPFSNAMRVWSRFGLFVTLAVSILAGLGAAHLLEATAARARWIRPALAMALLLLALFEYAAVPFPYGLAQVRAQPATAWLAERPGEFAVIELPLSRAMNGPPMYAERLHGKKIAHGYGTFFPSQWLASRQDLERFPEQAALHTLRRWEVKYVLLAAGNYGDAWPALKADVEAHPELRLVGILAEEELHHQDRWFMATRGTAFPFAADEIHIYELLGPVGP